jgi:hypothetical protein
MPTKLIVAAARPCIASGVTVCRTAMIVTFTSWPKVPKTRLTASSAGTVAPGGPCSAGTNRNTPSPSAAADTSTTPYPKRLGRRAASSEPRSAPGPVAASASPTAVPDRCRSRGRKSR